MRGAPSFGIAVDVFGDDDGIIHQHPHTDEEAQDG